MLLNDIEDSTHVYRECVLSTCTPVYCKKIRGASNIRMHSEKIHDEKVIDILSTCKLKNYLCLICFLFFADSITLCNKGVWRCELPTVTTTIYKEFTGTWYGAVKNETGWKGKENISSKMWTKN